MCKMVKTRLTWKLLGLAASLVLVSSAGSAACLNPPASAEMIDQFKQDSARFVQQAIDPRRVEGVTRELAGTDAALAVDLVRVARNSEPSFRTAVAAGLAQAALACSSVDQKASQAIQQAVAEFEDGEFQASFAAVAGDLSTAAIAAVASAAASSSGSVPVTNPSTASGTGIADSATAKRRANPVGAFSFSGITTVGASASAVTAATSVSPVR